MYNEETIERDALISDIIALGKNYKFYKYTNAQLWNIKMKLIAAQKKELQETRAKLEEMKKQEEERAKLPRIVETRYTEIQSSISEVSYFQDNETGQLSFFRPTEEEVMKLNKRRKRGSK